MRCAVGVAALVGWLQATTPAALAEPRSYVVVPERSSVTFSYTDGGEARSGTFEDFTGSGTFDVEAPGEARLEFAVAPRSIELGNGLFEEYAQSSEWFDSVRSPEITFRLTHLEPISGERYMAEGVLGIKGRERPISAPVRLGIGEAEAEAEGDLRIDRKAFNLGLGPSAAFADIGREVSVGFRLVARPVR